MIDLTEIVEAAVSHQWDVREGYAETMPWAELAPQYKASIKQKMLPLIHDVAEEVERRVREGIVAEIEARRSDSFDLAYSDTPLDDVIKIVRGGQ